MHDTLQRAESPAMAAALDAIDRQVRIRKVEIAKGRARAYLAPRTRWQLDMIFAGSPDFGIASLSQMEPAEALARLKWCEERPSYWHAVAALNIRGARIAFRLQRRRARGGPPVMPGRPALWHGGEGRWM